MTYLPKILAVATLSLAPMAANAALISVTGPAAGGAGGSGLASIIANPADVLEDGTTNTAQQGFDEQQNIITTAEYTYFDNSLTVQTLAIGSNISSHMIFLNTQGNALAKHAGVQWTFSDMIIGVMGNRDGSMEFASSAELGATGTTYEPGPTLSARGLEDINGNGTNDDGFSFAGNVLTLEMNVTEPGDWIRVITGPAPATVPLPAGLPLLLAGLGGMAVLRRKAAKKV